MKKLTKIPKIMRLKVKNKEKKLQLAAISKI